MMDGKCSLACILAIIRLQREEGEGDERDESTR